MKKILLIAISFILLGTSITLAEPLKKHNFEIGSEVYYYDYEEPGIMEDKGFFYGVTTSYAYHNKLMLGLDARFAYGQVDYTSADTGSMDNIDDYVLEARGLIGYDYSATETFTVTPYIGFGYRYLNDDTSGMRTSTGALGYERESNYYYSPIGLELTSDMQNDWSIGIIGEFDLFWQGVQKSNFGDAVAGFNNVSNDQDKGYGLRGSLKIKKKSEKIDILIEPYIRYWNIKQSETAAVTYTGVIIGYGYEPKNNTAEYGAKISLIF